MPRSRFAPIPRRRIQRGNMLITVRLAWYSKDDWDNTYHVCTKCPRYWKIYHSNLRITTEDNLLRREYEMCSDCISLLDCGCTDVHLEVTND